MASITKRPDGTWRGRYRDEAGKEHARHFARKVDGQRWLDEVTTSVVTGQYVSPKAGRVTLAQYAAGWQASRLGRPATRALTDNALRLHVLPVLGSRPLASIRHSDVQTLVKGLSETLAPGSTRNIYGTLARCLSAAVDDRMIAVSPCRKITLPYPDDSEIEPPSIEAVGRLAGEMPSRYRAAVILLAGSGLRIGELLALTVADVDFLRRSLRVERQRLRDGQMGPPKTPKSVRTVPLGQVALDELAAHLAVYPSGERLFTNDQGESLSYQAWKREFSRACARAGVELTTHGLRHFYASALIAGGASVKQVQAALGHASAVITLRTYAHLWPGDEDRTRAVSDAALSSLRTFCGLDAQTGGGSADQSDLELKSGP